MAVNPSLKPETANDPVVRGNPLNDPQFSNEQGYNSYDLNNSQLCSPRFGEVTPTTVFETVPGDRHVLRGNAVTFLNQIDARVVSEINSYMDYFFVPMRCVYPFNYEKLIPNPTKGDDLPNAALPQIPLMHFFRRLLRNPQPIDVYTNPGAPDTFTTVNTSNAPATYLPDLSTPAGRVCLNNLIYVAYALSRGQLLDYLGFSLDNVSTSSNVESYRRYRNTLQQMIDDFFESLATIGIDEEDGMYYYHPRLYAYDLTDDVDGLNTNDIKLYTAQAKVQYVRTLTFDENVSSWQSDWELSGYRGALFDALEKGLFVDIRIAQYDDMGTEDGVLTVLPAANKLWNFLNAYLSGFQTIPDMDDAEPFDAGFINPLRLGAYQLSIAEYMSNDSVDNVFTAELYMQNLRSVMFPSISNITKERTFKYNGVDTEYDLLTTGAFQLAFFDDDTNLKGLIQRMLPFTSMLFFLRRSLRYGDYFATGRPNMLAVGQLSIPVEDGAIDTIATVEGLVMTRYLNASNRTGAKFENYMPAMYDVQPSDQGAKPRFISHRKVPLTRDTVTNTAQNQGAQTTNLVGNTDNMAIDVFIDDFGCIVGVNTFDSLPVYPSGVDPLFYCRDRFSMFNSMLQNVGDQPILKVELTGDVRPIVDPLTPFAYTVRYAQYKYGHTRAHGAFVNNLPGYSMLYPWHTLFDDDSDIKINPDFIRDKPYYFDQFFKSRTGMSPGNYYHFVVAVTNQHASARKMQYQPPILW